MTYAQIKNNIVQNVIILDDISLIPIFTQGYDLCLRIDNITDINENPIGINWIYNGSTFSPS